ncbi:MAG: response regulator [Halovenus sp.]|uniref:response regulator n=1 Tax=Halovenus amylolytica TaxID=2500550 RepID=UPI000FE41F1A
MGVTVVLIVDRDEQTRLRTARFIRERLEDVSVLTANSLATARDAVENQTVDVVVTGYTLGDGNGLELADYVRKTSPGTGCILYTDSESVDTDSFEDVVVEFVGKESPDAAETLAALIEQAGVELTQASYPVPEAERERLEAADQFLTIRAEIVPVGERLAGLAVDHFDASAAAVTVISRDRQEIVAGEGELTVPTVREQSLATHTIVSETGVMAVGDTQADPRFADTEKIHDAGIRSYLGATIETRDGHAVGTLSVYDDEVREFSEADRNYIRELAGVIPETLALRERGDRYAH